MPPLESCEWQCMVSSTPEHIHSHHKSHWLNQIKPKLLHDHDSRIVKFSNSIVPVVAKQVVILWEVEVKKKNSIKSPWESIGVHGRFKNTPGSRGWSRHRDRTLAVPKKRNYLKLRKRKIFLLFMPKYWGKQIFRHGSFPKVGQKQKA